MPGSIEELAVRESFARQSLMAALGAEISRVLAGEVFVAIPFRNDLTQQGGTMHAGVIASIADSACGYAALTLMPTGSDVVSVEFKLNLLAPAVGERFEARAKVIRSGRTLSVCSADVYADGERLVATMVGTFMRRGSDLAKRNGMAKNETNQGGPTRKPKDEPTADRASRNAASRDELKERSVQGQRPGRGKRNGSDKQRHR